MTEDTHDTATMAQLKSDIDSGRTRDKVANSDPGLSPLGTDDEAAGTSTPPEDIARLRRSEMQGRASADPDEKAAGNGFPFVPVALATLLVLAVALVVWFGFAT